jgi:transcriptional regulator NrdR family protein
MEQEKKPANFSAYGTSMECPQCQSIKSKVVDKRNVRDHIIRRRQCENGHRYTTMELDSNKPGVIKKGSIDPTGTDFPEKMKNALAQSIDYRKLAQVLHIN